MGLKTRSSFITRVTSAIIIDILGSLYLHCESHAMHKQNAYQHYEEYHQIIQKMRLYHH